MTKFSSPSRKTSSVTYACRSVATFTSCIAATVTVSSEKVFPAFYKKGLKTAIKGSVCWINDKFFVIIFYQQTCRCIYLPSVQLIPLYPRSHPFKHVPFTLSHCCDSKQCPQGVLQLSPYIPSVQANNFSIFSFQND